MRKNGLILGIIFCSSVINGKPLTITGDSRAKEIVGKVIKALGGEAGIKKRRNIHMEIELQIPQEITMPGGEKKIYTLKANSKIWIKENKSRLEQTFAKMPGAANIIIFDGKELYLLINGQKRNPGLIMKKYFKQSQKRDNIWQDCFRKKLVVKYLGSKKIFDKPLELLEFTDPEKDKTTIGVDPKTHTPVYIKFMGINPNTGQDVLWTQHMEKISPVKEAGGLLFPHKTELYQGKNQVTTLILKKVEIPKSIPDNLFGKGKDNPVD